jgi:hypothetical protein
MAGIRPQLWGEVDPPDREDRSRSKEHKGAALQMVQSDMAQTPDWDALNGAPYRPAAGERVAARPGCRIHLGGR